MPDHGDGEPRRVRGQPTAVAVAVAVAGGYQAGFPPLCPGALGPGRWARM